MNFAKLQVANWRQFADVSIEFHDRLTIVTGANGAGKSTLLRVLAQHFGFSYGLHGTPEISKDGSLKYLALTSAFYTRFEPAELAPTERVGEIQYSDGRRTDILVPTGDAAVYNVQMPRMQSVSGLFIGSHRPQSQYQRIGNIPTDGISAQRAYQAYNTEIQNRYTNSFSSFSPIYRIKEAIISMATFGPGNKNVQGNPELERTLRDFEQVLTLVLPASLGYKRLSVRIPDVVLITSTGEFLLDSASGGLMALIDLAWQVFLYSRDKEFFTTIIDEPENHLHPSMQRLAMSALLSAFPNMRLVVATHSPFVVSSVRDSNVYVLQYDEGHRSRRIRSVKLDQVNRAGTANEILRNALGVPVTIPMWAEDELSSITSDFAIESMTPDTIAELRRRLQIAGLQDYYGEALAKMSERR